NLVIGVTDKGLLVGPENEPLDPAHQVSDAITNSGVTVKFLPAVETADSVLSSGLEISMEEPIPSLGSAKGVVSYIVRRTFAQADSAGFVKTTTGTPVSAAGTDSAAPAAALPSTGVDAAALLPGAVPGVSVPAVAPAAVAPAAVPTVDLVNAAAAQRPL